jgi:hypothetical protein
MTKKMFCNIYNWLKKKFQFFSWQNRKSQLIGKRTFQPVISAPKWNLYYKTFTLVNYTNGTVSQCVCLYLSNICYLERSLYSVLIQARHKCSTVTTTVISFIAKQLYLQNFIFFVAYKFAQ